MIAERQSGGLGGACFIALVLLLTIGQGNVVVSTALAQSNAEETQQGASIDSIEEALKQVNRAVFQIRVTPSGDRARDIRTSGTGFLVEDGGWGITNYHVVREGASADAVFVAVDDGDPVPVQLWHVRPDLDLALVRLRLPESMRGNQVALTIADAESTPGTDVWAVGFPRFGHTVTKGVVSAVRSAHELIDAESGLQPVRGFDPTSRWIQTDCTINSGNSGGPLLDRSGVVVGINTWSWPMDSNVYFALSALHIAEMLRGRPQEAVTFEGMPKTNRAARSPRISIPDLEHVRYVHASRLLALCRSWERAVRCRQCRGTGEVTMRRQTGWSGAGAFRRAIFKRVMEPCPNCKSGCIADGERLAPIAEAFVSALAGLDPDDRRAEQAYEQARRVTSQSLALNPSGLMEALNGAAKSKLSSDHIEIAAEVMFVGYLDMDLRIPSEETRIRFVTLPDSPQVVVILDAKITDAVRGEPVLVGGLLAGYIDLPDREVHPVLPVLQHGFIVAARR